MAGDAARDWQVGVFGRNEASRIGQCIASIARAGRGLRLPLGLYRGDGLLGSMAAHDLDPLSCAWENRRVMGVRDATCEIVSLSPFRPADLRRVRDARPPEPASLVPTLVASAGTAARPVSP